MADQTEPHQINIGNDQANSVATPYPFLDRLCSLVSLMSFSVGDKLGPYEILAPIGAGGMGEVWKARDTRLGRNVAIKFSKSGFTERAAREARAIAQLNHPNICHLLDVASELPRHM